MSLKINSEIPNLFVQTSIGDFFLFDWLGDDWGIIFSHPKDFTPVCTTELGYLANLETKFKQKETKIIANKIGRKSQLPSAQNKGKIQQAAKYNNFPAQLVAIKVF